MPFHKQEQKTRGETPKKEPVNKTDSKRSVGNMSVRGDPVFSFSKGC